MRSQHDQPAPPPPSSGPAITPHLRDSLARLMHQVESQNVVGADTVSSKAQPTANPTRDRNTDYGSLIAQFMASIPEDQRQRKFRMAEFVAALAGTGRYSEQPASRLIGTALHQAGWTTHRSYKKGSRNARLWCPPQDQTATFNTPTTKEQS